MAGTRHSNSGPNGRMRCVAAGGLGGFAIGVVCLLWFLGCVPAERRPVETPAGPVADAPSRGASLLSRYHDRLVAKLKEKQSRPKRYDNPSEAMEYYIQQRVPPGMDLPVERYEIARQQIRQMEAADRAARGAVRGGPGPGGVYGWQPIGPGNVGGRTRAWVIDPTNPNIMYAAGVAGGIWKSTDGGATWNVLDDMMANLAVCALAMDWSNPQILYAGTGEGYFNIDAVRGLGIFKSTDGGATWNFLTGTLSPGGNEGAFFRVNDIEISRNDPNRIYAATRYGVFRSDDAGGTWTQILRNLSFPGSGPTTNSGTNAGCMDIAIRPDQNPDVIFAAFGSFSPDGIYRSTDGGSSWTRLSTGLPGSQQGRIALAIAPSDPNTIYACVAENGTATGDTGRLVGVYRSTDGGNNWTQRVILTGVGKFLLSNPIFGACFGQQFSQGWYDNVIAVDPLNRDIVWVGGIDLFRSDDGGQNWGVASYWWMPPDDPDAGDRYVHADIHRILFHPNYNGTTNKTMYVGTDGGLFRTLDARAAVTADACPDVVEDLSDVRWQSLNNGYQVTQFYHGDSAVASTGSALANGRFAGGTQDNGTNLVNSSSAPSDWREVLGGDGGYTLIDPNNPNIIYAESQFFGAIEKSVDGGQTFNFASNGLSDSGLFIVPVAMDPVNSNVLWTGGRRPWRTTDGAANWQAVGGNFSGMVSAIAIAATDGNVVYMGLNNGSVAVTSNALAPSPAWITYGTGAGLPSGGYASGVTVDPTNPDVGYVTYSTFGIGHVYRTTNRGANWTRRDGSGATMIPDIPAHWLAIAPCDPNALYVGTDLGVFASGDAGATWIPANLGSANTVVESLDWLDKEHLVAFTHGRSAFVTQICTRACIVQQPSTLLTCEGRTATFSVVTDGPAATFEWTMNGQPVGENSNQLILSNVSPADSDAQIQCRVVTPCAEVLTNVATLTVEPAIQITKQPTAATTCDGTAVVLGVEATGNNLSYQWLRSGIPVPGATSSTLVLPTATAATLGTYSVRVSNVVCGTVTSSPVQLSDCNASGLFDACEIAQGLEQDCNANLRPDSCESTLRATLGADIKMCLGGGPRAIAAPTVQFGTAPLAYQWRIVSGPSMDGLVNATAASPIFDPMVAGDYVIEVSVADATGNACRGVDTILVSVAEALDVDAGSDRLTCVGVESAPLGGFPLIRGGHPPYAISWFAVTGIGELTFSDRTAENPRVMSLVPDDYVVRLMVRDSSTVPCEQSKEVVVRVAQLGVRPGVSRTISVGQSLVLGGLPTAVGGTAPYAYFWNLVQNPGGQGTLSDVRSSNPVFQAFAPGNYETEVEVTDGSGCQGTARVSVEVVTAPAGPGGTPNPGGGPIPGMTDDICALLGGGAALMPLATMAGLWAGQRRIRRVARR
ncbi:MAG: hypothetical protein L6Q92_04010 [Phycisphaerae bacterium]|nr:hypothetical protein [Phycisphaerae bacterium]